MPQIFLSKPEWEASPHKAKCKLFDEAKQIYLLDLPAGQFFIDTEDPTKLKSALDASRREKDAVALELKNLKDRMDGADSEAAKKAAAEAAEAKLEMEKLMAKNNDFQGLMDQIKADREADRAAFESQLAERDAKAAEEKAAAESAIVTANARAFCATHFGDEDGTLAAMIQPRLRVGAGNQLSAVDSEGNPMTMEDFQNEVLANPVLAPIIQASKGSGVGDTRGVNSPVDIGDRTLDQLDSDEQLELLKNNPEQFEQLQAAAQTPDNFDKPGSML